MGRSFIAINILFLLLIPSFAAALPVNSEIPEWQIVKEGYSFEIPNQIPNDNIHIDRTTRSYHNRNYNFLDYFAININNYRGMLILFFLFSFVFFSTFSIINYTYYLAN